MSRFLALKRLSRPGQRWGRVDFNPCQDKESKKATIKNGYDLEIEFE